MKDFTLSSSQSQSTSQGQEAPAAGSPEDRATEFKAVDGSVGEHFNGYTLMVEAYAVIWLVLMGWLVVVWRQQANLTQRVNGLEAAIARAERKMAGGKPAAATKPAAKAKTDDAGDAKSEKATEAEESA